MSKIGKVTLLATAAEAARQWARNNPDKASTYIDKAGQAINKRTGGKYTKQVTGASAKAKDAVAKQSGRPAATTTGTSTTGTPTTGTTPPPPYPGA